MQHSYNICFVLGYTQILKDGDNDATDVRWAADESSEACIGLSARARETLERLRKDLADLQPLSVDPEEVPYLVGNVHDPEVCIRRFHRLLRLIGTWEGGRVQIDVFDNLVEVSVNVAAERLTNGDLRESIERLLIRIESATHFTFLDMEGRRTLKPASAASFLLHRHHKGLLALRRAARRSRRLRILAAPSAIVMTIITAALMFMIVRGAFERGRLVLHVDPAREETFVTTSLVPPTPEFRVWPSYTLEGHILATGERASVPVSREVYIRAAPGARHSVLRTSDPAMPLVLSSMFDPDEPVLRIGDEAIAWFAIGALLPAALWGTFVLYPWLRTRGEDRALMMERMTKNLLTFAKLASLLAVIAAIKRQI